VIRPCRTDLSIKRDFGEYVMENTLFKVAFPAEFHAQTAVEAAFRLHPQVVHRIDEVHNVTIHTTRSAVRCIDKTGPLQNPADRDHCLQYVVAVALLYGGGVTWGVTWRCLPITVPLLYWLSDHITPQPPSPTSEPRGPGSLLAVRVGRRTALRRGSALIPSMPSLPSLPSLSSLPYLPPFPWDDVIYTFGGRHMVIPGWCAIYIWGL